MSLEIRVGERQGRSHVVSAYRTNGDNDELIHRDSLNLNSASRRERFARTVASWTSETVESVEAALLDAVHQMTEQQDGTDTYSPPDDPHRLAEGFLARWTTDCGHRRLVCYRDEYYHFTGTHYRVISPRDVKAHVTRFIQREFDLLAQSGDADGRRYRFSKRLLHDVLQLIESIVKVDDSLSLPIWLGSQTADLPSPKSLLASPSGLLNLEALADEEPHLLSVTPSFFSTHAIDFSYDSHAQCPRWLEFVNQLWPGDSDSVQLLQEWFGYVLTLDTSQQKLLMLCGPPRSGKGTIGRILVKLVGESHVVGPTLRSLQSDFGLQPLIGKPLAIVGDARLSARVDAMSLLEVILSITGEDSRDISRKHLPTVTMTLPTRFMIMVNEFPRFQDASDALFSRLLLIQLRNCWTGREDTGLTERLSTELPGILNWALQGLQSLRQRGGFIRPQSSMELLQECRRMVNPIGAFMEDCLESFPGYSTPTDDVWRHWILWSEQNGVNCLRAKASFSRSLQAAIPHLRTSQPRRGEGRQRAYFGIRLRPECDPARRQGQA